MTMETRKKEGRRTEKKDRRARDSTRDSGWRGTPVISRKEALAKGMSPGKKQSRKATKETSLDH